jgi:hypothetical protein
MSKPTKTRDELHAMVLAEVRKFPDYDEVKPLSVYPHEPDEAGCNWDIGQWQGPKDLVSSAHRAVMPALTRIRLSYSCA